MSEGVSWPNLRASLACSHHSWSDGNRRGSNRAQEKGGVTTFLFFAVSLSERPNVSDITEGLTDLVLPDIKWILMTLSSV